MLSAHFIGRKQQQVSTLTTPSLRSYYIQLIHIRNATHHTSPICTLGVKMSTLSTLFSSFSIWIACTLCLVVASLSSCSFFIACDHCRCHRLPKSLLHNIGLGFGSCYCCGRFSSSSSPSSFYSFNFTISSHSANIQFFPIHFFSFSIILSPSMCVRCVYVRLRTSISINIYRTHICTTIWMYVRIHKCPWCVRTSICTGCTYIFYLLLLLLLLLYFFFSVGRITHLLRKLPSWVNSSFPHAVGVPFPYMIIFEYIFFFFLKKINLYTAQQTKHRI